MPRKLIVYRKKDDPKRIIAEHGPYLSSYLIQKNKEGEVCAPWAIEEMAIIKESRGRMDYPDYSGLKSYSSWALGVVQEEVKKSAQQRLL